MGRTRLWKRTRKLELLKEIREANPDESRPPGRPYGGIVQGQTSIKLQ